MSIAQDVLADDRLDAAAAALQHRDGDAATSQLGLMPAEEVGDAAQQPRRFFDPHTPAFAVNNLEPELGCVVITLLVLDRLTRINLGAQIDQRSRRRARPDLTVVSGLQ